MIDDVTSWRRELIALGDIAQDGEAVAPYEAERGFRRYVELADQVAGTEGQQVFQALIDSMVARHDYGAYQSTLSAAFRFPPAQLGAWLFESLPVWLERDPDRAGDWLGQLAFLGTDSAAVEAFNAAWARTDEAFNGDLLAFVEREEADGWLSAPAQRGVLRP